METLMMIFPLILTNNLVMSVVKTFADKSATKTWLRAFLLILSGAGIIATSSLTGNEVDFNQLSDIGTAIAEIALLYIGSHYSYRVIKTA